MQSTQLNKKTRILILLCASLILLSFSLTWYSNQKKQTNNLKEKIQLFLDTEYEKINNETNDHPPQEIDFQKVNESPFDLYIKSNDSVLFWNNFTIDFDQLGIDNDVYFTTYRDADHGTFAQIGIDIAENGKLDILLKEKFGCKIASSTNESTVFNVSINNSKNISKEISIIPIQKTTTLNLIAFLSYLLSIGLLLVLLYRFLFIHKSISIVLGILILFIIYSCHSFWSGSYFGNNVLSSIENTHSFITCNLQEFWIQTLMIFFLGGLLRRTKVVLKAPKELGHFIAPAIITSSFIYIAYCIKGFLDSYPLNSISENALQYENQGIIFILSCIASIASIFYLSIVLFKYLKPLKETYLKYGIWIIGIAITYPITFFVDIDIPLWTIYTFLFAFCLILEMYMESKEKNVIYTFWWIIIFSGFLASVIFFNRLVVGDKNQKAKIEKLYSYPQNENIAYIKTIDSTFQESEMFRLLSELPYPSGLDINDYKGYVLSILRDKGIDIFEDQVDIEVNDQEGITLFNNHFSNSYKFTQSLATGNRISEYIFYNPFDGAYYLRYQVDNTEYTYSPFIVLLKITIQNKDLTAIDRTTNYVVFKNNNVVRSNIINSENLTLKQLSKVEENVLKNDISYNVYHPTENVKIISYSKIGGLIKPISLFSFIVALSAVLVLFLSILNTRFSFLPLEIDYKIYDTSSLRTRIQVAIIFLIVFSFMIIGVVTAIYFKNVLENKAFESQREDITKIINDLRNSIEGVENFDFAESTVQSRINEMSVVHGEKLAFFDRSGNILKKSFDEPQIARVPFEIVRAYSNPNSIVPTTRINLKASELTMDFIPMFYRSQSNPYGYLAVAHEQNDNSGQSIKDFLSTILNVYIFLFLIAGALAIFIGNSITQPLHKLSQKLKEFKLGKTNQSIEWTRTDEIGKLINEYNQLLEKLDDSVKLLAKTERDGAWREMAKQVAHEIKNPLTPMKLSIQYMEKAIKADPSRAQELVTSVSNTLVEQINNLSHIANEFSNFATMPKAENEKVVINELVEHVHDLFRKREDMDFKMSEPIDDLLVYADRNQLLRIIINIVKNATQAIPTDRRGEVFISLKKIDQIALISIRDNGTGIPDDMKEKVFTPNFTTKSSGTGLGLAISSNIIDSFNGRIYFETEIGIGTEFFIEIPLMRLKDNFPQGENRVMLD